VIGEELPDIPVPHVLSAQFAVAHPVPADAKSARALPTDSPLKPSIFLKLNALHHAAMRASMPHLRRCCDSRAELARMLQERDATGLTPVQRAYVCYQLLGAPAPSSLPASCCCSRVLTRCDHP
jgi:hypothetical protein